MAGVRLEFAQFGHFDYFKIYRNSVSTAIENLGEPIGSSSTMYYEDLTVESNQDYYYRAGVVRNSIEEFSGEFHVKTVVEFDPPYNLIVEFKNDETNRLELNWNLDGFIDEQRYYCSETPIDTANLPVPKAVLASHVRSYVDTDIEFGNTYYVVVSSVKGGIEKVSQEVEISAEGDPHWDKVVALLHFDGDLTDETGRIWTPQNNPQFSNGVFGNCLDTNAGGYLETASSSDLLLDGDFTIEFWITPNVTKTEGWILASRKTINWEYGIACLVYFKGDQKTSLFTHSSPTYTIDNILQNETAFVTYARRGTTLYMFKNGVLQKTQYCTDVFPFNYNGTLLCGDDWNPAYGVSSCGFIGKIDEFRITKDVARYTANFIPPDAPFLNY
ncbi:LamG-like jellyroll fold domain-containing protein [Acinetobacter sp.]|uniref:LamG-like jellyroll fold domain-containing protein n=1 Tax=Acinetobacter sp. TaxID=472 RepID=UPI0025C62A54|nr:LamG-like jellyroll fold domain-containing protein [Acinetobacter sp.]